MTANQRRPGFRLPWSSEDEGSSAVAASDAPALPEPHEAPATTGPTAAAADVPPPAEASDATPVAAEPAAAAEAAEAPAPTPPATAPTPDPVADPEASPDFMRDLVSAMRRVADEARQTGISEIQATADEQVRRLEADAEARRTELRTRADADVAGIGEWAKAEAERIRKEADQRVISRREQLEQQLAAETARAEAETKALRDRISEYERELDAYHAQLAEISDPAAFAAAAKRMPRPPALAPRPSPAHFAPARPRAAQATVTTPTADQPAATNGVTPAAADVHPAEEEVLATRLAELDADLTDAPAEAAAATASAGEPTTTEIVVSGLGSFGAITGFRQSLAGVQGVEGVALSLGQTGEFIFRATHRTGFDMAGAITGLEGDAATVETRPDGGLHVTLDRSR
jgi:hypothetical protein